MRLQDLYSQQLATGQLQPDAAQHRAMLALAAIADELARPCERVAYKGVTVWRATDAQPVAQGAYLFGPVGRGKSMLMQLLFDAVPVKEKRRVHFHPFMEELHQRQHAARPVPGVDMMLQIAADIAADARLLCFDEFYVTNIADAMLLGRLLEALFMCGVTLCATSNWAPDDLFQDGHNRGQFMPFIGQVQRHTQVIDLAEGTDWRRADGQTELVAAEPRQLFAALSGGAKAKPATVELAGHVAHALGWAGGAGWFSFSELCGQPLGSREYLALLEQTQALVVSDIPRLDAESADAALRFVVLVDLLYELQQPVRLTSAAPLAEICVDGPAAFAFERTLSRLQTLLKLERAEA